MINFSCESPTFCTLVTDRDTAPPASVKAPAAGSEEPCSRSLQFRSR